MVLAPSLSKAFAYWFSNPETVTWTQDWHSAFQLLRNNFGPGTRVAVIPNATMQYYDC
jgi:hypothetical protein